MKWGDRGFTLIELILATGVSVFVLTMLLTENASFFQQQMFSITRSNLVQDTILEANYISQQIQNSGGGNVRSWMSIWDDNSCPVRANLPNCLTSSDRLTIATSLSTPVDCTIQVQNSANTVTLANTPPCCTAATFMGPSSQGNQLMLVLNTAYSQVYATGFDASSCLLTYAPGQASPNDATQGVVDWSFGSVSVVQVQTFFVDPTANQLNVFSDLDHTGAADATNLSILANNVFDLQVALGYDLNGDNNIIDTNSTSDEWLFNAAGDQALFPSYQFSQLKMVEVGVIAGTKSNFKPSTTAQTAVQILDGPNRQAQANALGLFDLRAISFKVQPRNN